MGGSDSDWPGGQGGRYRIPYLSRSRSAAQLNVGKPRASEGVTGPILWFMALALKADHFRTRRRPSLPAHYVEHGIALDLDATVSASPRRTSGRRRTAGGDHIGYARRRKRTVAPDAICRTGPPFWWVNVREDGWFDGDQRYGVL
jgi:hypothetical protein